MMQEVETRLEQAKDVVENAAERTSTAARKGFLDTAERVARVVSIVRGLGVVDVMTRLGVERRRSTTMEKIFAFGGGLVVGAGVAMLVAPTSGSGMRRRLTQLAGLDDREPARHAVSPAAQEVLHAPDAAPGVTDLHEGRPA